MQSNFNDCFCILYFGAGCQSFCTISCTKAIIAHGLSQFLQARCSLTCDSLGMIRLLEPLQHGSLVRLQKEAHAAASEIPVLLRRLWLQTHELFSPFDACCFKLYFQNNDSLDRMVECSSHLLAHSARVP